MNGVAALLQEQLNKANSWLVELQLNLGDTLTRAEECRNDIDSQREYVRELTWAIALLSQGGPPPESTTTGA